MKTTDIEDALSVCNRGDVLAACRDETLPRSRIDDQTDRSCATVYRATKELEAQGLLESTSKGYRTTARGVAVVEATERLVETCAALDRLDPLLDAVDAPELLTHLHLLADARTTVADDTDPYGANDRALELWNDSERVRGAMTASGSRHSIVEGTRHALDSGMHVEMCYTPAVFPTKRQLGSDVFGAYLDSERVEAFVTDDIPFSFALHETVSTIVAHDETGVPSVLVESEAPEVRRWLEGVYADCRANATPIEDASVAAPDEC